MSLPIALFNDLERKVLDWCANHYNSDVIASQVKHAQFKSREWTKVGYYVDFYVPRNIPRLDKAMTWPLDGPYIKSSGVEDGGQAIVWQTDGYLDCLEMFSFGSCFEETLREFTLEEMV